MDHPAATSPQSSTESQPGSSSRRHTRSRSGSHSDLRSQLRSGSHSDLRSQLRSELRTRSRAPQSRSRSPSGKQSYPNPSRHQPRQTNITDVNVILHSWTVDSVAWGVCVLPALRTTQPANVRINRTDLAGSGYGCLEPKPGDRLQLQMLSDADDNAVESCRLLSLASRSLPDWLAFVHRAQSRAVASAGDLGDPAIVWRRLLGDCGGSTRLDVGLSAGICRLLLTHWRRRRRRRQRGSHADRALDEIYDLLVSSRELGGPLDRLLKPLAAAAAGVPVKSEPLTEPTARLGTLAEAESETQLRIVNEITEDATEHEITPDERILTEGVSESQVRATMCEASEEMVVAEFVMEAEAVMEAGTTFTKVTSAAEEAVVTECRCEDGEFDAESMDDGMEVAEADAELDADLRPEAACRLFGDFARVLCARAPGVLERPLLPMAKDLPMSPGSQQLLLQLLTIGVEMQRRHQLASGTVAAAGTAAATAAHAQDGVLPTRAEVASAAGNPRSRLIGLRPALEKGAYGSVEEYIDTMFKLLRADCFEKFYECMARVKSGKLSRGDGMRLYINVKVAAVKLVTRGAALRIGMTFDLPQFDSPPGNWAKSGRLMPGNLVCLGTDHRFSEHYWATVVEKNPGELTKQRRLVWIQPCVFANSEKSVGEALVDMLLNSSDAAGGMIMLESSTMFRAFQPVLESLKNLEADSLPFSEALAFGNVATACSLPGFIKQHYANAPAQELTEEEDDVLDRRGQQEAASEARSKEEKQPMKLPFISAGGMALDPCQSEAFANALHRQVYVCQGPPGTGKTLLGVLIARQLLQLEALRRRPILVLCYKNHALDEFLTQLLPEYAGDMVRIGGRSQEPRLDAVGLFEQRRTNRTFRPVGHLLRKLTETWQELRLCLDFFDHLFKTPASAILNARSPTQLRSIVCQHPPIGRLDRVPSSSGISGLMSAAPDALYGTIMKDANSFAAFEACVQSCLPSLEAQLNQNRPQQPGHSADAAEPNRKKRKVTPEAVPSEPIDDGDEEEIREREDQLMASSAHCDNGRSNNANENLAFEFRHLGQSSLYLDRSIEKCCDSGLIQSLLSKDLKSLAPTEQWLFYQLVLHKVCKDQREVIKHHVETIMQLEADKEYVNIEADANLLARKRVIGMTITGASINKELLDIVQPAVILLEEAAEVGEPQLLGCLGPHIEQLILIGDHKQLKPQTENYLLARDYHLDLSLMERLINNGIKFDQLELQSRMRPEFSCLLRDIYPNLRDNLSVVSRVLHPECLAKSMFFWTHTVLESMTQDKLGATNNEEAERCVRLAMFLIEQGCAPDRITVLSAYRRQTSLIRRLMQQALPKFPLQEEKSSAEGKCQEQRVKVYTIDLYQGDENDVVIVSLVRSNSNCTIGFLKSLDRRCVAQSRARLALVFIGNAECLYQSQAGKCWRPLIDGMKLVDCLGPRIPLRCANHPVSVFHATSSTEVPLGTPFCKEICGLQKSCRVHHCLLPCQPRHDLEHSPCKDEVTFAYPECGHDGTRFCYQSISQVPCSFPVTVKLEACGHTVEKKCSTPESYVKCSEPCQRQLRCGHGCCPLKCHEDCNTYKCQETVPLNFPCGHNINTLCPEDRSLMICQLKCTRQLQCGHACTKKCSERCSTEPCKIDVKHEFPNCGHTIYVPCCQRTAKVSAGCESKCERNLPCGHNCTALCSVDCSTVACRVKIRFSKVACQHQVQRFCFEPEDSVKCRSTCGKALEGCGHKCVQECSQPCDPEKCELCEKIQQARDRAEPLKVQRELRKAARDELKRLKEQNAAPSTRAVLDNNADEYLDVKDKVVKFIQPEHGWNPHIKRIEKISNSSLLKGFLEFKAKDVIDATRMESKFHGTTSQAVESIILNGFKLPTKDGMFGSGIYFATDSSKSSQAMYTKGSNMLLLCDVLIGRTLTVTEATNKYKSHGQLKAEGYDSLFAPRGSKGKGGVLFDEYVVFDPRQALPKYIVHYDALNTLPKVPTQLKCRSGTVEILPSRYHKPESPESVHLAIVQAEYRRVDGTTSSLGDIAKVIVNRNPDLEGKFEAKQKEFQASYGDTQSKIIYAFHGTSKPNADAIFKENFRLDKCKRQAYGPGIYFSEFTAESQSYGNALLLCKLLPGREVDHPNWVVGASIDSIRVRQDPSKEHCKMLIIQHPDQILPLYRIFTDKFYRE